MTAISYGLCVSRADGKQVSLLMRLLHDFINYRSQRGIKDSREGCLTLTESKASIHWVKDGDGELLAEQRWAAGELK